MHKSRQMRLLLFTCTFAFHSRLRLWISPLNYIARPPASKARETMNLPTMHRLQNVGVAGVVYCFNSEQQETVSTL